MSGVLKPGQKIDTARGLATVLEVRPTGVWVHLAQQKRYATLNITEIFPDAPTDAGRGKRASVPGPVRPLVSPERRTLEALRFGLVPVEGLEDFTIGFDDLRSWTLSRLPDASGKPSVSEICGPFGTGKSHSMAAIRHVARQEGFVTAGVEVDGRNVSLSEPERVLYSLWRSLRAEDLSSATPLLELYLRAIGRNERAPMMSPGGQDRIWNNYSTVRFMQRGELIDSLGYEMDCVLCSSDEVLASEVERRIRSAAWGLDSKVMRMIGRKVDERPHDFVESLAGQAMVAKLAGYKGLVVTIDEFEVEQRFLSAQMLERVDALLAGLLNYLQGKSAVRAAPLAIFIASVGQEHHRGDAAVDEMIEAADGD